MNGEPKKQEPEIRPPVPQVESWSGMYLKFLRTRMCRKRRVPPKRKGEPLEVRTAVEGDECAEPGLNASELAAEPDRIGADSWGNSGGHQPTAGRSARRRGEMEARFGGYWHHDDWQQLGEGQ